MKSWNMQHTHTLHQSSGNEITLTQQAKNIEDTTAHYYNRVANCWLARSRNPIITYNTNNDNKRMARCRSFVFVFVYGYSSLCITITLLLLFRVRFLCFFCFVHRPLDSETTNLTLLKWRKKKIQRPTLFNYSWSGIEGDNFRNWNAQNYSSKTNNFQITLICRLKPQVVFQTNPSNNHQLGSDSLDIFFWFIFQKCILLY